MYILGNDLFSNSLLKKTNKITHKIKVKSGNFYVNEEVLKFNKSHEFVLAVKNQKDREMYIQVAKQLGYNAFNFPNIVLDQSLVLTDISCSHGNIFMPFSMLDNSVELGNFNLLDTYSSVYSHSVLGDSNVLDSYATVQSKCKLGKA